jgi:hypothetical protein
MYCLECNSPLKKRQKKFCSYKCMNVYNARVFKEQHKEDNPEKWRVCDICNEEKNIWQFSLLDKTRKTSIKRKTTCKNCSAAYKERERKNRNWKFDTKKVLYNNAKQRAKKLNIEFTLTKDDIDIPDTCPVFGFPLKREGRETWMYAPSIDRIDNTKGYIKENIIIVSRRANILKKDATLDELRKLADYYEHFCDA